MPRLSIQQIEEAVVQGIQCAQKKYLEWSNGDSLYYAPEYFITMNIAEQIIGLEGPKFVTLEYNAKYTLEDAGALGRGRLSNDLRANGRVDIVVWYGKEKPRAVIEIKKFAYDTQNYEKDIHRIKKMLQHNHLKSSLQFGIFAYYDEAVDGKRKTAQQALEEKKKRIYDHIQEILPNDFIITSPKMEVYHEKDYSWCAGCFLIRYKSNKN